MITDDGFDAWAAAVTARAAPTTPDAARVFDEWLKQMRTSGRWLSLAGSPDSVLSMHVVDLPKG